MYVFRCVSLNWLRLSFGCCVIRHVIPSDRTIKGRNGLDFVTQCERFVTRARR
jgi:hypothetical protein